MLVPEPEAVRIYDFLLGGKDNFQVDRDAAYKLAEIIPEVARTARANRAFIERVVHHVVRMGIRQIIDIGMGLPVPDNVHEIAQSIAPETRVVYVDNDSMVVRHGNARIATKNSVAVIESDLITPREIMTHPDLLRLIDFRKPVAVLMLASLHYVSDDEHPQAMLELWHATMRSGSYLAISHGTADSLSADEVSAVQDVYKAASAAVVPRTHAQVESFFKGFKLAEPGVVDINVWPVPSTGYSRTDRVLMYGGLGRRTRKLATAR